MARYRKHTSQILYTDSFRGIDAAAKDGGFSAAVTMRNYRVTPQHKLKKRCGYKKLTDGVVCDSCFCAVIGGAEYFIYKNGTALHAIRLSDLTRYGCDTGSAGCVGYFVFGSAAYIYGVGSYYKFDGARFCAVEPYIPTVAVSCTNSGAGTLFESLNIISDKAKISYSPDGVSASFVLPSDAAAVVSVELDGDTLDGSGYGYDAATHTLTLSSVPQGGVPDSLIVTFSLDGEAVLSMPFPGRKFCLYGGARDTRVFAYGGGNVIRYSDVTTAGPDVTYFPADNFITVGDGTEDVTALIRHFDRLMVFTERQTWFLSPSSVDYDGYSKPAFPLSPLNQNVGSYGGGAAYADNSPYTLSYDGIYKFGQSTVRDERNAKRISDGVSSYISPTFLKYASVYDCEREKEIWMCCGGGALIYNYGIDAFYYYDGIPAQYVFGFDGGVAFYSGAAIYVFSEACADDDGQGFSASFESGFVTLDRTVRGRRLRRVCMSFDSDGASSVTLYAVPDRGNAAGARFTGSPDHGGFDFGRVDFTSFSFGCSAKRAHAEYRVQLSSFECLKIMITSGESDGALTVGSVSLIVD